ncbi:MAG: hypothetical protein JSR17_00950 [Proteobacteria bacterium]|nr:hypothetical protein [Pseudomonadota bacterium]
MNTKLFVLLVILIIGGVYLFKPKLFEHAATSPGTLDQLATSSVNYPVTQFDFPYPFVQDSRVVGYYGNVGNINENQNQNKTREIGYSYSTEYGMVHIMCYILFGAVLAYMVMRK